MLQWIRCGCVAWQHTGRRKRREGEEEETRERVAAAHRVRVGVFGRASEIKEEEKIKRDLGWLWAQLWARERKIKENEKLRERNGRPGLGI